MLAHLLANPYELWLSLGGLLLAAELLGAGGYLLWSGVAALLTGALSWLLPMGWEWEGLIFAVLTVAIAVLWWRWLQRRPGRSAAPSLNQRANQLLGLHATLTEAVVNGVGRASIGDSSWRVTAEQDLAAGAAVEVVAVEGITLRVRPLPPSPGGGSSPPAG